MKILVDRMPDKKEECLFYRSLFYRREKHYDIVMKEYCSLNNKKCSFKNQDSIFGGECRCLQVKLF
jgi:hypothetical protein